MKKFILFLSFVFISCFLYAQELENNNFAIPAEKKENVEEEEMLFERIQLNSSLSAVGPFNIERYKIDINLIDLDFSKEEDHKLDILAIGRAEEMRRRAGFKDIKAPTRQMQQIRSQVQVFRIQSDWARSNDDLQYDGRKTRDGGIRNEALKDIRQPFINPYYGRFGRPYYYDHYYGTPSNYYFYRR